MVTGSGMNYVQFCVILRSDGPIERLVAHASPVQATLERIS